MNDNMKIIWYMPIGMLLLSFIHWPYRYYILLRLIVTACAGYLAYMEYNLHKSMTFFAVLLMFFVIFFNPILPVYLPRIIWSSIDIFTALTLFLHHVAYKGYLNKS